MNRYGKCFNAVEINSSFYRPHLPKTYSRWAESVPEHFRFSVKIPKTITHEKRLKGAESLLSDFLSSLTGLKEKLGVLLIQLPPSLSFDASAAGHFFDVLRAEFSGKAVLEPRHVTWGTEAAETLLEKHQIGRVFADPPAASPNLPGRLGLHYLRLHGSPKIYYSNYEDSSLETWSRQIETCLASQQEVWCIFDNTAQGFATTNAFAMRKLVSNPTMSTPTRPNETHAA